MSNSAKNPKPLEKYEALKAVIVRIKINTGRNMNQEIGKLIYSSRPNPAKDFSTTCSTAESATTKHFTEMQWQIIEEEIYQVGSEYIEMFYNFHLLKTYGLVVIDMMQNISEEGTIEADIKQLTDQVILESSDVLRSTLEIFKNNRVDDGEPEQFMQECDEAIRALVIAKLKMKSICEES